MVCEDENDNYVYNVVIQFRWKCNKIFILSAEN